MPRSLALARCDSSPDSARRLPAWRAHRRGQTKSSSQPTLPELKRLFSASRRSPSFSSTDSRLQRVLAQPQDPSTQQLQFCVFRELVDRLQQAGIRLGPFTIDSLYWCLPQPKSDAQVWLHLLEHPLQVSDDQLQELLSLRKCLPNDEPIAHPHCCFYIRSYQYTVLQFREVLASFASSKNYHIHNGRVDLLLRKIHTLGEQRTIWVRYCGMTTNMPLNRLREQRRSGEDLNFNAFISTITKQLFPEVEASVKVFELVGARTTGNVHHSVTDLREQITIALLDTASSLNTRAGGKHPDCSPSQEVAHEIARLDMHAFAALERTVPATWPYDYLVREYGSNAQSYTRTQLAGWQMTDEYKQVLERQAMPQFAIGTTWCPIVTIAHDPTEEAFRSATAFFDGDTFTNRMASAPLELFYMLEHEQREWPVGQAKELHGSGLLPLVDMYQWPEKTFSDSTLPEVLALLRTYLHAASPVITVTWSRQVSRCADNSFLEGGDAPGAQFLSSVGTWHIVEYAGPEVPAYARRNCCTIAIASYHPNAASYGVFDLRTFNDVYHMTLTVA